MRIRSGALLLVLLSACGSDESGDGEDDESDDEGGDDGGDDGGDEGDDRGGPDSLVGFEWTSDPVSVNGIEFVFGFRFDATSVTARNTCNGELTAEAQTPVRYLYTADVPDAGRAEEVDGGDTCSVEIAAGTFDFEIAGDRLAMTYQGTTLEFEPDGDVAGLYGAWRASAPGVGTLIWSMGGGKIAAVNECDNGLTAEVEVDATFINKVEFTEAAEDIVDDGAGLECSVGIAKGTSTYRFDGEALLLTTNGEEIRLGSE